MADIFMGATLLQLTMFDIFLADLLPNSLNQNFEHY